jgi:hypothetical protein
MKRPWLAGCLVAIAALAALGSLLFVPRLLYPPLTSSDLGGVSDATERITLQQAQAKLQNDARSTLLQRYGGFVLFLGAVATWRQVQISRHGQLTNWPTTLSTYDWEDCTPLSGLRMTPTRTALQ